MSDNLVRETIANIVRDDYRAANVFIKYGIDFCCGGKRPLAEVCEQKGVSISAVLTDLKASKMADRGDINHDFDNWTLPFLADYIENVHHQYVRNKMPQLLKYASKVALVHGNANPETVAIKAHLETLASELETHMEKEEEIVFPYIRNLWRATQEKAARPQAVFGELSDPISLMEEEHEAAGGEIAKIRLLSNDYEPPEHACNTYRVLYALLDEFEKDLFRHIHLENNILFPKALKLEAQIQETA